MRMATGCSKAPQRASGVAARRSAPCRRSISPPSSLQYRRSKEPVSPRACAARGRSRCTVLEGRGARAAQAAAARTQSARQTDRIEGACQAARGPRKRRPMRQVFIVRKGPPSRALEVRNNPQPVLRAGEVRVRVRAAGVNFADLMSCYGLYPDAPARPFVPGYEVAGEIDEVSEGVPASRRGERVVATTRFGGYSEMIAIRHELLLPMPPRLSFAEAASIPVNWLTAWHMLVELANLKPGQRVLVHAAAGGVGLAALQICKRIGAEVIGTASAP